MDPRTSAGTPTVLLAGATGLVGRALLVRLLAAERRQRVIVVARKPLPATSARDPRLTVRVGEMATLAGESGTLDDAYIALGTTIKVAGSEAAEPRRSPRFAPSGRKAIAGRCGRESARRAPRPVDARPATPCRPCIRVDGPHMDAGVIADPYDRHAPRPARPSMETRMKKL